MPQVNIAAAAIEIRGQCRPDANGRQMRLTGQMSFIDYSFV